MKRTTSSLAERVAPKPVMITKRSEPHVVSERVFTSRSVVQDIESILGNAARMLPRKDYLDALCNVSDITQDRIDRVNDEIGREMHGEHDAD